MRSGRLGRHRVSLHENKRVEDAAGQVTDSWKMFANNVAAEVRATSGRETFQNDQVQSLLTHVITIRYREDVSPQMRAKEGSRTYHIEAVQDPSGYKRELRLLCREVVT